MEMGRNLSIASYNSGSGTGNHQFGASSSNVKVEDEEETRMSLTQWLNPTKLPLSYLTLLNEEPPPNEKSPPDYVVKKVVLPSRRDAAPGPGGGIRTLYSVSECDQLGSSKVIRVQSRTNNNETCSHPGGLLLTIIGGNQMALLDISLPGSFGKLHDRSKEMPKSMKQRTLLFPNTVGVSLPQKEALLLAWKEKLERDAEILKVHASLTSILAGSPARDADSPKGGSRRESRFFSLSNLSSAGAGLKQEVPATLRDDLENDLGCPIRVPAFGYPGKEVLSFEDICSSKNAIRFDRPVPGGYDLGGLCEGVHGFFCAVSSLGLDGSSSGDADKLAGDEIFEDAIREREAGSLILFFKDVEKSLVGNSGVYAILKKSKLEDRPRNILVMASQTQPDNRKQKSYPGGLLLTLFGGNQMALLDISLPGNFGKLHDRSKEMPKSMKQRTLLFPNTVGEEALLLVWKEKLECDAEILKVRANLTCILAKFKVEDISGQFGASSSNVKVEDEEETRMSRGKLGSSKVIRLQSRTNNNETCGSPARDADSSKGGSRSESRFFSAAGANLSSAGAGLKQEVSATLRDDITDVSDAVVVTKMRHSNSEATWSLVVPPGRYISVNPGKEILRITGVAFLNKETAGFHPYMGSDQRRFYGDVEAAECEIYLGINSTREEFRIGILNSFTTPQLSPEIPAVLNQPLTLGHNGFAPLIFTGFISTHHSSFVSKGTVRPDYPDWYYRPWPLSVDLTAKVMSMLGSSAQVAITECVSKIFRRAGRLPVAYSNVDLTGHKHAEGFTALMCIRRTHGLLRSLSLGQSPQARYVDKYDRRVLMPLVSSAGRYLTKLKLVGVMDIRGQDMLTVFPSLSNLTDFETYERCKFSVNFVLRMVAQHCVMLERLVYGTNSIDESFTTIKEETLDPFVVNCTKVKSLTLKGVFVADSLLERIFQGLGRLRCVNLSNSSGFDGLFLSGLQNEHTQQLRVLALEHCRLKDEYVNILFQRLRDEENCFPNLQELVMTYSCGFEKWICLPEVRVKRAKIKIKAPLLPAFNNGFDEDGFDRNMANGPPLPPGNGGIVNVGAVPLQEVPSDYFSYVVGRGRREIRNGRKIISRGTCLSSRYIYWSS